MITHQLPRVPLKLRLALLGLLQLPFRRVQSCGFVTELRFRHGGVMQRVGLADFQMLVRDAVERRLCGGGRFVLATHPSFRTVHDLSGPFVHPFDIVGRFLDVPFQNYHDARG